MLKTKGSPALFSDSHWGGGRPDLTDAPGTGSLGIEALSRGAAECIYAGEPSRKVWFPSGALVTSSKARSYVRSVLVPFVAMPFAPSSDLERIWI